ncbi:MAG TPA: tetratricopeptide repeat-containing glycosyltransferase family protein, partial [Ramlibacter sp.]|nr:tetratricopeptide repeat-containing glycosyltransferase family protein [Ramlibacter sp.]
QRRDWRRALAAYREVLTAEPDQPDALYLMGAIAVDAGEPDAAVMLFRQALVLRPDDAGTHHSLAIALDGLKRHDEALVHSDRALAATPAMAAAWTIRGDTLLALGREQEALASHERAVALAPGRADLLGRQAACLMALGQDAAALAVHDAAMALDALDPGPIISKGIALNRLDRAAEAMACFEQALAVAPHNALAKYNQGLLLLSRGDYARGWALFEHRWATPLMWQVQRTCPEPLWLGAQPLAGKTILLHNDQGLGDAIMLSRFAASVAARGAQVVLQAPPALVGLLRNVEGVRDCVARGDPLPPHDLHCPLFSLPLALQLRLDSVPAAKGYLRSDPDKAAAWAQRLGLRRRPQVGLVWSGNPKHDNDRHRTLPLSQLAAALPQVCDYVSLQAVVRAADRPVLEASPWLRDFSADLRDFSETAALCEAMDLVVCVDTSVAHLAGAMGKPTWILLPFPAEYRWLRDRDDTPWYASARLLRQAPDRQWAPLLARLRGELQAWAQTVPV